ncbi:hypothetical protein LUX73_24540 [Actinomadura madurae]|nr:hypothetical protein [Actinomadura madurae]MCQ0007530.1 hypothetical protein [Actinomadura madurae]
MAEDENSTQRERPAVEVSRALPRGRSAMLTASPSSSVSVNRSSTRLPMADDPGRPVSSAIAAFQVTTLPRASTARIATSEWSITVLSLERSRSSSSALHGPVQNVAILLPSLDSAALTARDVSRRALTGSRPAGAVRAGGGRRRRSRWELPGTRACRAVRTVG